MSTRITGLFGSRRSVCPRFEESLPLKRVVSLLEVLVFVSVTIVGGIPMLARAAENPAPLDAITSRPPATAADPTASSPPPRLTAVAPPANLSDFVEDETGLLKLGKALFWDMQLGSDGIQACASCHFHAGADNRSKNQITPGLLASPQDKSFSPLLGGGPNYQITAADFPFRKLSNPNLREDAGSTVISDTNDVASSQGVFSTVLIGTVPGQAADNVRSTPDPDGFIINGINVRRVEPRNIPTVVNVIFNKLQFWDGRANGTSLCLPA